MDHVYNGAEDSAFFFIRKIDGALPGHPVIPLLKAMTLLWANVPTIDDEVFSKMEQYLILAISRAKATDPDLKNPEMIFFSMVSYGLLAEYYADRGHYSQSCWRSKEGVQFNKKRI